MHCIMKKGIQFGRRSLVEQNNLKQSNKVEINIDSAILKSFEQHVTKYVFFL